MIEELDSDGEDVAMPQALPPGAGAMVLFHQPPAPAPAPPPIIALPPPAPPELHPTTAHEQYWRYLWSLPISNHAKVFGVRLLHAALPCPAMYAARRGGTLTDAACTHCRAHPDAHGRRGPPLADYSHLFVHCPVYAPAITWLCDLWQHLTGNRPPTDASVIVADQPGAWAAAPPPNGPSGRLWSVLRLTVLYFIWAAHESKDPNCQSAGAVVRKAIRSLRSDMRTEFGRYTFHVYLVQAAPARVAAMRRCPPPRHHFHDTWATSGLCHEVNDALPGQDPRPRLVFDISDVAPVPAP